MNGPGLLQLEILSNYTASATSRHRLKGAWPIVLRAFATSSRPDSCNYDTSRLILDNW